MGKKQIIINKNDKVNDNSLYLNKKFILKNWLAIRIKDKIQSVCLLAQQTQKPITLYRNIIEESEDALKEEVCMVSGKNQIVVLLYVHGGFIPSYFHKLNVFTIDKFTKWILREEKKDLLLSCLDEIEEILNKE